MPDDRRSRSVSRVLRDIRTRLAGQPLLGSVALVFAWLLLMRGVLLFHSGVWPSPGWMLLADVVGAVVLALLLSLVRTFRMRLLLILLLGLAFYTAGAHMGAHGTIFRVAHALKMADPVLVASSVATPWLLLLPLYVLLAYLLHRLHERFDRGPPPKPLWRLAAMIGCIVVYGLSATSLTYPANNVVVSTLAQIPGSIAGRVGSPERDQIEPLDANIENLFFHREVRGEPVDDPPNVLLILVEGLSAAYLPAVAGYHDLSPVVSLPALEQQLDRRGFRVYRNVLGMQRQTDRGSYPLLCGTYPRLGTERPEMADVADGEADPYCVPEVLASHGYRTGYLQAAPIEYMDKDRFMPRAGFERVDGAAYFRSPEDAEGWGPGDDIFFPAAAGWIADLDAADGPWFGVMLNAGTHHPFTAQEEQDLEFDLPSPGSQQERQGAFEVMARELPGFLDRLAAAGILEDTLVIISSDEGGGFLRGDDGPLMLDGNFGALAVRLPGGGPLDEFAGRDRVVATLDIALTTLDVAGLADSSAAARAMIGRSLLVRQPSRTRGLLLGDAYAGYTVYLLETGTLIACGEALVRCTTWRFSPNRLFGSLSEDTDADPYLEFSTRRQLVHRAALIEEQGEFGDR